MQILDRSVTIIDPRSSYNGTQNDILISDGEISEIGKNLDSEGVDEIIEGDDLHVSTGWVDLYATFGDPGFEHKEDILSGLTSAAQGGFTKVAVSPQAQPAVDSKAAIEYLLSRSASSVVDALPLGAQTKGLQSLELAEMFDMQTSGAIGTSNGKHTIGDTKLQNIVFQYGKNLNLKMYSFCQDERLSNGGQMHEGTVNTSIGLKGVPSLAEEVAVTRDLYLAEYSNVAVHFSHITTKGSVDLIRTAKAKGLKVTASVPAHHLLFTDKSVEDFEPNFKVNPPFRGNEDVEALLVGLEDGTLDAIISDHEPHEIEAKASEFSVAEAGIISLESTFSVAFQATENRLSLEQLIGKLTSGPRDILNLAHPIIKEGNEAELTIFSPSFKWTYLTKDIKSKSKNSPVINKELTGLPIAVINKGKFYLNS